MDQEKKPKEGEPYIMIDGLAEWEGNGDRLLLNYWFIQDGRLDHFKALCPHELQSVGNDEIVSPLHISQAMSWLLSEALPKATKVAYGGKETLFYPLANRSCLYNYPTKSVDKWDSDKDKIAKLVLKSAYFENFIRQFFFVPGFLNNTPQINKIKQMALAFIASEEVQAYFLSKYKEMAEFWVDQICVGMGESGSGLNDVGVVRTRLLLDRFSQSIVSYCDKKISEQEVPFFDIDYDIEGDLRKVLETNDLMYLARFLPSKARKPFEWSDAPKINFTYD